MKMITLCFVAAIIFLLSAPVFAGRTEMLTVGTSAAVGISASTRNTYRTDDTVCLVGPIETNSIRVTYSSPTTTPTSTTGHLLDAGSTLTLRRSATRDEVSNFLATAVSATSTVPVTCN